MKLDLELNKYQLINKRKGGGGVNGYGPFTGIFSCVNL